MTDDKPKIAMLGDGLPTDVHLSKDAIARVKVIGIGGAGANILEGLWHYPRVAISTNEEHLRTVTATDKILLTRREVEALCTVDLSVADIVGTEGAKLLRGIFSDVDIAIIVGGLGGTTFGPLAPFISRIARQQGTMVLVFAIIPFSAEGPTRAKRTTFQRRNLKDEPSGLILLSNDALTRVAPKLPLKRAFDVMNRIVADTAQMIISSMTRMDIPAMRSHLSISKEHWVTGGACLSKHFPERLVKEALESPWIDGVNDTDSVLMFLEHRETDPKDAIELAKSLGEKLGPFNLLYSIKNNKDQKKDRFKATLLLGIGK